MNSLVSSSPSIAPTLTSRQLSVFRSRLEGELTETYMLESRLRAEIVESVRSRRSATTNEGEDPEGSSIAFEGAQTNSMLTLTSRHTAEITAALHRVDDGRYGICSTCGDRISTGRLEARPSTDFCISCAS